MRNDLAIINANLILLYEKRFINFDISITLDNQEQLVVY